MSGYASFDNFSQECTVVQIPCVEATLKSIEGLGKFVSKEELKNHTVTFSEVKDARTQRFLEVPRVETEGKFNVWQKKGFSFAENHAVESGLYTVAKMDDKNPYKFYFREVNYHPDGTQLVFPEDGSPFILILGSSPEELKALIFDGSCGFDIFPGIYHQPPVLHYFGAVTFFNKQPKSHICSVYDSVEENGYWWSFEYA